MGPGWLDKSTSPAGTRREKFISIEILYILSNVFKVKVIGPGDLIGLRRNLALKSISSHPKHASTQM